MDKGVSETDLNNLYPQFRNHYTRFLQKRKPCVFTDLSTVDYDASMLIVCVVQIITSHADLVPDNVVAPEPNASSSAISLVYQKELLAMEVGVFKKLKIVAWYKGRGVGYTNSIKLHHNMQHDQCMYKYHHNTK